MNTPTYFGKYRGVVSNNKDPLNLGRIRAKFFVSTGERETGWALPCFPFAGAGMGFFALPKLDAKVWIEFEGGDLDFPIWTGAFFDGPTDLPPTLLAPPYKKVLLKTEGGHSIVFDDTPGVGGITLETSGGQKIKMTAAGIEIDNGMGAHIKLGADGIEIDNGVSALIKLSGPQVTVNNGALEVV